MSVPAQHWMSMLYSRQAPQPGDLLAFAQQRFLEGRPVDVPALADELGVARATAYRWARSSDHLVGQVVATLVEDIFAEAQADSRKAGPAQILDVYARALRALAALRPLRDFLEREPQRGLLIVGAKNGPVHGSMLRLSSGLIERACGDGALVLTVNPATLAYAMVRIAESFLYADLLAGEDASVDNALAVLRLLLEDAAPSRPAPRASRKARTRAR